MNINERKTRRLRRLLVAGVLLVVVLPIVTLVGLGIFLSADANAQAKQERLLRDRNEAYITAVQNQVSNNGWARPPTTVDETPAGSGLSSLGGASLSVNGVRNRLNPAVAKLVQSIKTLSDDEIAAQEEKTGELRDLLNQEFAQMHERQGEEIAKTQERLDSLKRIHGEREEKKDLIIQRRINDLLGEPDELAWIAESREENPNSRYQYRNLNNNGLENPDPSRSQTVPLNPLVPRSRFPPPIPGPANAAPRATLGAQPPANANRPPIAPGKFQRPTQSTSVPEPAQLDFGVPLNDRSAIRPESLLNEIFQLVRSAAEAISESKVGEAEWQNLARLQQKGLLSDAEVQKAVLTRKRLARQAQIYRQQIEALQSRLVADARYAKEIFEKAAKNANLYKSRFEAGTIREDALFEVQRAKLEAQKRLEDAQNILDQFKRAIGDLPETKSVDESEEIDEIEHSVIEEKDVEGESEIELDAAESGAEDSAVIEDEVQEEEIVEAD